MSCQAGIWLPLVILRRDDETKRSVGVLANHLQSWFDVRVVGDDDHVLNATRHCVHDRVQRKIDIALLLFQFPDWGLDAIARPLLWILGIEDLGPGLSEGVVPFDDLHLTLQVLVQRLVVLLLAAKRVLRLGRLLQDGRGEEFDS